jgi:hypothetical protein
VAALAAMGVSPQDTQLCSPAVLRAMPYTATAFELGFPVVLLTSLALGGRTGKAVGLCKFVVSAVVSSVVSSVVSTVVSTNAADPELEKRRLVSTLDT